MKTVSQYGVIVTQQQSQGRLSIHHTCTFSDGFPVSHGSWYFSLPNWMKHGWEVSIHLMEVNRNWSYVTAVVSWSAQMTPPRRAAKFLSKRASVTFTKLTYKGTNVDHKCKHETPGSNTLLSVWTIIAAPSRALLPMNEGVPLKLRFACLKPKQLALLLWNKLQQ